MPLFPFGFFGGSPSGDYSFITSDDSGGPEYAFTDISGTGTELDSYAINDGAATFDLVSFTFPFYGTDYTTIWLTNNGLVELGTEPWHDSDDGIGQVFGGGGFDDSGRKLISAFLKDLRGVADPAVFYYQEISDGDGKRVVIQWDSYTDQDHSSGSSFTFQVILWESGRIQFVYEAMTAGSGGTLKATIGLQKDDATGLSIATAADSTAFVHSNLLVQIS